MRLASFDTDDGPRWGLEIDGSYVDARASDPSLPAALVDYLREPARFRSTLEALAADPSHAARLARTDIRLAPPIPDPGKIICIGLNYRDHAAELGLPLPEYPSVFVKWANVLVGDGTPVVMPHESAQLDYEAELGFIIGRTARRVSAADAYDYIAGYTAFNDVSVRDFQNKTTQWTMGKNFDTHGPCGPVLVTTDEIPDPQNLAISSSIGGEVLQSSNTREMVFSVSQIVEILSMVMTLEPGDLVVTGTPPGVAASRKPPRWMRPGERIRIEIEKIGAIENEIVGPA